MKKLLLAAVAVGLMISACKKEAEVKPVKSSVKVSDDGGDAKNGGNGDGSGS